MRPQEADRAQEVPARVAARPRQDRCRGRSEHRRHAGGPAHGRPLQRSRRQEHRVPLQGQRADPDQRRPGGAADEDP